MEKAGQHWKWPYPRDMIYYLREKLVIKLDKPVVVNNRNHFKFTTNF
jgi:hypothetical protein